MGRGCCILTVPFFPCAPQAGTEYHNHQRFHLNYHTLHQVFWGLGIGITFGTSFYVTTELIPARRPGSHFGRIRALLLCNPISVWLRIRDGWLVWRDGGHEEEWKRWRSELDRRSVVSRSNKDK